LKQRVTLLKVVTQQNWKLAVHYLLWIFQKNYKGFLNKIIDASHIILGNCIAIVSKQPPQKMAFCRYSKFFLGVHLSFSGLLSF